MRLTEAELGVLRAAWSAGQDTTTRVVKWIVAARVEQVEAERDALRERVEDALELADEAESISGDFSVRPHELRAALDGTA